MRIVKHRVNTIEGLISTPESFGVEIDIRTKNSQLVLEHDPFSTSKVKLKDWLEFYNHSLLVVNVKEDGLENEILEITRHFGITNFSTGSSFSNSLQIFQNSLVYLLRKG